MKRPDIEDYHNHGVLKAVAYMEALGRYCDWIELDSLRLEECTKQNSIKANKIKELRETINLAKKHIRFMTPDSYLISETYKILNKN